MYLFNIYFQQIKFRFKFRFGFEFGFGFRLGLDAVFSRFILSKIYIQKSICDRTALTTTLLNNRDIYKKTLVFHYKTYKKYTSWIV